MSPWRDEHHHHIPRGACSDGNSSTGRVSNNRLRPSAQRRPVGQYMVFGAGEVHFDGSLHSEAREEGGE